MREMIKVISAATELTGNVDKAIYRYRNEPIVTAPQPNSSLTAK